MDKETLENLKSKDFDEIIEFGMKNGFISDPSKKKKRKSSGGRKRKPKYDTPFSKDRSMQEIIEIRLKACRETDPEKDRIKSQIDSIRDGLKDRLGLWKLRIYVFKHRNQYMIRLSMRLDGKHEKAEVFPAKEFMESEDRIGYVVRRVNSDFFNYPKRIRNTLFKARESDMSIFDFVKNLPRENLMKLLEENPDLGNSIGESVGTDIFHTIRYNLRKLINSELGKDK